MRVWDFLATRGMDDPRVIEICETCKFQKCDSGICEDFIEAYYKLYPKTAEKARRKPDLHSIYGVRATLKEWCEYTGASYCKVRKAVKQGVPLVKALGYPHYNAVLAWERERGKQDG